MSITTLSILLSLFYLSFYFSYIYRSISLLSIVLSLFYLSFYLSSIYCSIFLLSIVLSLFYLSFYLSTIYRSISPLSIVLSLVLSLSKIPSILLVMASIASLFIFKLLNNTLTKVGANLDSRKIN